MQRLPVNRLPLLVVGGLLVLGIAVPMTGGELGFSVGSGGAPAATPASPGGLGVAGATATPVATATAPPTESPSASPTPAPTVTLAATPVVPVTQFRSPATATSRGELAKVLAGTSGRYEALTLVRDEADAILAAIGIDRPADPSRLVLAKDAATLTRSLAKQRKRIGLLRADDVTPAVRALAWGDRSLFGVDRVKKLADWRLNAELPPRAAPARFDPAASWTLFAGGDILLDRGVYETLRVKGRGEDFPFDGGTAAITGRTCCSSFGWEIPKTRRTGNAGAVRDVIEGADLAMANFENPAPNRFRWHTSKTVFTADPTLIDGLVDAGIDYVSLANNHIGDAGDSGILQTIGNLKKRGLKYSGAGKDLAAARKPATFDVNGTRVAILAYDQIAPGYHAAKGEPGSAKLTIAAVKAGVKAARKAGAKVVIVFPHWGVEYRYSPFQNQQRLARRIIDAGADMIIGNHAHYAAAVEVYKGRPIWYALGNFIFDQTWSEPTMEGITLELTFHGADLRQIRMRPHIILDKAQPNFLDPAKDGRFVLGPIYDASKGLLPY
jgi:poly-gamma-glutamate synthesis protein (capsule biosynthesis protein)